MGLRPTNTNEGASGRCREINNWDRACNRVLSARIPETFKHPRPWLLKRFRESPILDNRSYFRNHLVNC